MREVMGEKNKFMLRRTAILIFQLLFILCSISIVGVSFAYERDKTKYIEEDFEIIRKDLLQQTDSIEVSFFNYLPINRTLSVKISDKGEVTKVINIISSENSSGYDCGYSGEIDLLDKDHILILKLKFNLSCNEIVFSYKDQYYLKKMTMEGIEYLYEIMFIRE